MNIWEQGCMIKENTVKEILVEQFEFSENIVVRELSSGWDSSAFLIDNLYVFRFPKREDVEKQLEMEKIVLEILAHSKKFFVRFPKFIYQGHPSKYYPFKFIGYEIIDGKEVHFLKGYGKCVLNEMSDFINNLHSIDDIVLENLKNHLKTLYTSYQWLKKHVCGLINSSEETFLLKEEYLFAQEILQNDKYENWHGKMVLTHSDLNTEHLFLDKKGNHLVGIIDWGDVCLGEPSRDWAGYVMLDGVENLPEDNPLWTKDEWNLIKERAVYKAILALLSEINYGCKANKIEMAQHRRLVLKKIMNSKGFKK